MGTPGSECQLSYCGGSAGRRRVQDCTAPQCSVRCSAAAVTEARPGLSRHSCSPGAAQAGGGDTELWQCSDPGQCRRVQLKQTSLGEPPSPLSSSCLPLPLSTVSVQVHCSRGMRSLLSGDVVTVSLLSLSNVILSLSHFALAYAVTLYTVICHFNIHCQMSH